MHLYATDEHQRVIFAGHAAKQQDYFCLECRSIVRVRGGPHRHTHYYHLSHNSSCRLSNKSMVHLQTQVFLQSLLPQGDVQLEMRFPEINRIADVAWISQKIIFEIQCSSITASEVEQRNQDYGKQGFQVVWILHDKRYNQWRVTGAEHYLQGSPFYFTNMDADGRGEIYDQWDVIAKGVRKTCIPPLTIDIKNPRRHCKAIESFQNIPKNVQRRISQWPLHFSGDLIATSLSLTQSEARDYFEKGFQMEASLDPGQKEGIETSRKENFRKVILKYVVKPYRLLLQMMLERACK